ncbi:MAG: protein YgfX [Sterolibacterium sp.]
MQLPLSVKLQPSRKLTLLLVAVHVGAILVVAVVELSAWNKAAMLLVIGVSLWNSQRCMYGARRIAALTLRDQGKAEYLRSNGETGEVTVHLQSTVTSLLTVILLRQQESLEALVLLPDSLGQDDFRRLRLWLRWQAAD